MRTMKLTFGLIGAAIPVLYCGGLLLHFNGVRNMFGGMLDSQLGPTMLGLGAFGLLFLILFGMKLWRTFGGSKAPGAGGGGDPAPEEEKSDFDPDAALARYMARRSSGAPGPASPLGGGGPVRPAGGFGRRGV